jgi:hypothetical protein
MEKETTRATWEAPALVRFGTFRELTLQGCTNKTWGASDGFTLQGDPITCASRS